MITRGYEFGMRGAYYIGMNAHRQRSQDMNTNGYDLIEGIFSLVELGVGLVLIAGLVYLIF